jgi:hypothetical protein
MLVIPGFAKNYASTIEKNFLSSAALYIWFWLTKCQKGARYHIQMDSNLANENIR